MSGRLMGTPIGTVTIATGIITAITTIIMLSITDPRIREPAAISGRLFSDYPGPAMQNVDGVLMD
jgi:hypothetical protein